MSADSALIPVIAIDGPSASGKGTVAQGVAEALGFHYLDSGALYRLVALAALRKAAETQDEAAMSDIAAHLDVRFSEGVIYMDQEAVTDAIRSEECGAIASKIAAYPGVREALLARQRRFRQPPGLVADGRDMGSVVFPDAKLKVFLTAGVEIRAERRYKQLIGKGIAASIRTLSQDLRERDARDAARTVAPLVQLPDACLLDTTHMTVEQAVQQVLSWYGETGLKAELQTR
ncbi:MAG TPA: (d)CMP kinase [Burkholderiales bacterium]|nr:(d)CMP kinase [Burkholderiales bacterium]